MRRCGGAAAATLLLVSCLNGFADPGSVARPLARAGKVDAALAQLPSGSNHPDAEFLRCQLFASIEERDEAIKACEAAVQLDPGKSEYALGLARAYGAKAEHSGALTGMRLVGKVRSNFERAVELDGKSMEALSDLGQFYVEAPGMVGGGVEKAQALVPRLQAVSPARAHRLLAMIAAKQKDDAGAIREYREEMAASQSAEAYVDLATFYKSRKQAEQAADQARQALQHDAKHGPDTLDAAFLLMELKQSPAAAQAGLRAYLNSPQQGVAQYARAHVLLGRSLADGGDRSGAMQEFQAALSLAHGYQAAQQGLH